jgi:hypothetical protein
MPLHSANNTLRAAVLLGSALLTAQAASPQHVQTLGRSAAPAVVTLDASSAYVAANRPVVAGEASFANPPANFYSFAAARVGEAASVESIRLHFAEATTLGAITSTADFPMEPGGSCVEGQAYAKGDTCLVLVRFTPQGAGRRLGKLTVAHSGSAEPDGVGLGGNGYAPVLTFSPAAISTVAGTYPSKAGLLSGAANLTVDGGDILYIADEGNGLIRQIDATGNVVNRTPVAAPQSVAVDNFGLIYTVNPSATDFFSYYEPTGGYTYYFATYTPGNCTALDPCDVGTVGMGAPANITMDPFNDLFVEAAPLGVMLLYVAGVAGGGTLPPIEGWYLDDPYVIFGSTPSGFGVNSNDSLFTAYTYPFYNTCWILEESLYAAESTDPAITRVAGGSGCGFAGDGGPAAEAELGGSVGQIAFDAAGDMYFSDTENQRVRMVNVSSGIITTIAGNGTAGYTGDGNQATTAELRSPTGVAVDSQGQVYIISGAAATGTAQVVRKLGPKGFLAFSTQAQGTTSSVHILTVSNTGNSTMTLTREVITGNDTADFSINNTDTSCVLTAGATLAAGQHCQIGVVFKPSATGPRTATLTLVDNTVNNSNSVQLSGVGTAADIALAPTTLTFPSTTQNQTATVPVTVTNSGTAALTISGITVGGANPKMFTYTSSCGTGSIGPKGTCKLQVSFKPTSAGSYSALVRVADNAPDSPQSLAVAGTSVAPASSLTRIASSANPASGCSPVTLNATVVTEGNGVPIGAVELKKNGVVLATAKLSNGTAAFTATGLAVGSNLLTAGYEGDAIHAPSTSAPFTQVIQPGQSCSVMNPFSGGTALPTARP